MIKLTFSEQAKQDLQDIGDFIARDNAEAALALIERLESRCSDIAVFPRAGRRRDELRAGYRSISEGDYLIFYKQVNTDEWVIVRILHGKQDLGTAIVDELSE